MGQEYAVVRTVYLNPQDVLALAVFCHGELTRKKFLHVRYGLFPPKDQKNIDIYNDIRMTRRAIRDEQAVACNRMSKAYLDHLLTEVFIPWC